MSDLTFIKDLRVRARIGVTEDERRDLQDVVVNVEFRSDQWKAAESDDVADAVDYRALNKRILAFVGTGEMRLVETLAQGVARLCLQDARIDAVRVRVEKPGALRFADSVGVEIERTRGDL